MRLQSIYRPAASAVSSTWFNRHQKAAAREGRVQRLARLLLPSASYPLCLAAIFISPFDTLIVGKYLVADLLFIASAFALVPGLLTGRFRLWLPWWLAAAGIALGLSFAARTFASGGLSVHEDNLSTAYVALACLVVPVVIGSQPIRSSAQMSLLLQALIGGYLVSAAVAVLQHQNVAIPFFSAHLNSVAGRVAGFTNHPNTLGFYLAMAAPLCLAAAFDSRSAPRAVLWASWLGLCFYGIDLSGSRTSLVAGTLGCGMVTYFFLVGRRPGRIGRPLALAAFVAASAMLIGSLGREGTSAWARLLGNETSVVANQERDRLSEAAIQAFWNYPIGGLGYEGVDTVERAHNLWLGAMEAGGLPGLLAVLIEQTGMAWYALRLLRLWKLRQRSFAAAVGLTALYVVWLLHGLKEAQLLPRSMYVALGLIGLLCIYQQKHKSTPATTPVHGRPEKSISGLGAGHPP